MNKNIKRTLVRKKQEIHNQEEIKKLLDEEKFFIWLNDFSNKMSIFTDINDYDVEEIDKENINKLRILYNLVSNEARKEYAKVNSFNLGLYYVVENLNNKYQIGFAYFNDSFVYFCSRCDENRFTNVINIDNIRKNHFMKKQKSIEELKKLKNLIINMLESNIKEKDINDCVNEGIEEYKEKQFIKFYFDRD